MQFLNVMSDFSFFVFINEFALGSPQTIHVFFYIFCTIFIIVLFQKVRFSASNLIFLITLGLDAK